MKRLLAIGAALILALAINALLFGLVPGLSGREGTGRPESGPAQAVYLTAFRPPPPPEKDYKKKPPKPKEPPPKPLQQKAVQRHKQKRPKVELKTPKLEFEINPALASGLTVAPPPRPHKPKVDFNREFEAREVDREPRLVSRVPPIYPYSARRRGINGEVVVRFLVDTSGRVNKLTIVRAQPKGIFEQAVEQSINRWRFKPGYFQGRPVATWVVLPIRFKLSG
jgi:protein TonB